MGMDETTRNTSASNGEMLVSRRAFLYGTTALAGGAVAAVGLATAGCSAIEGGPASVSHLEVPESSLATLNDFEALDSAQGSVHLLGWFDLPYGTLVWANDEEVAACLLPTSTGSPLTQVGLLFYGSDTLATVLERAVGAAEHYEVYDVRATSKGLVWTEANVLKGTWRVYTAKLADGAIEGGPVLVEEGDASFETPMLAVSAKRAFWQVVPKAPNDAGLTSRLMSAAFGDSKTTCVLENARRMGTPP